MKGSMLDIIGAITLVFFFSITAVLGWVILDKVETSTAFTSAGGNVTYLQDGKAATEVWDWGIMFILFGAMFFSLLSAYQVDTHPALFIFGIIVFMITVIIAMIMSNAFYSFYHTAELATAVNAFPMLTHTMDHLVELLMVYGFVLIVVTYGKLRGSLKGF
jgi:hypothetical protein